MGLGLRKSPQFDMFEGEPRAPSAAPLKRAPDERVVAVVDDDEGARSSTSWFLEGEGYRVLAYPSGDAFLRAVWPAGLSCVLLDIRMPGRSGIDVLRALAEREDAPAVVMLTGHGDVPLAVEAMKLKAVDFIQKPYRPMLLVQALERAARLREQTHVACAPTREAQSAIHGLSDRQRQVLAGVAGGRPNKLIAWELGLSVRTVEAYRAQLFAKLGVRTTAEAVRIAVAAGIERVRADA